MQQNSAHFEEGIVLVYLLPSRDLKLISYERRSFSLPVHTGYLERKKRFTRAYTESYFVVIFVRQGMLTAVVV